MSATPNDLSPAAPDAAALTRIAVIGAGPVGLTLALHAAHLLPTAHITLFDARPLNQEVAADPRTLALSLGSVQLLQRLNVWPAEVAQPILEVHVSQQPPSGLRDVLPFLPGADDDEPELRIRAVDEAVPMLGAVLRHGQIVAPLQREWQRRVGAEPARLSSRFGATVAGLKPLGQRSSKESGREPEPGIEVDAGIAERFDLAVVAEGGVFAEQARKGLVHDYQQTAWVGRVTLIADSAPGVAYERFTRHGPAALLPLRSRDPALREAALVWCVPSHDDPVRELNEAQRLTVLNHVFHSAVGPLTAVSPLKDFALGLNAERTLVRGRQVVIGNAAQTLHPVAGQGLNLGLRDAFELVEALRKSAGPQGIDAALRRVEWVRAPDRWLMIAATDFLARSFTWQLPGMGVARGLGLSALGAMKPLKTALARRMMFGVR